MSYSSPYSLVRRNPAGSALVAALHVMFAIALLAGLKVRPLLDRAALDEARKHWRLRPATRAGIPFESWYTLRVVFNLQDR